MERGRQLLMKDGLLDEEALKAAQEQQETMTDKISRFGKTSGRKIWENANCWSEKKKMRFINIELLEERFQGMLTLVWENAEENEVDK